MPSIEEIQEKLLQKADYLIEYFVGENAIYALKIGSQDLCI